ncbi:MAG TPA: hypothetical protein PK821_08120, partial [Victivallales bacterium]|nr:hypothetical protein [Victivallales bacterium]
RAKTIVDLSEHYRVGEIGIIFSSSSGEALHSVQRNNFGILINVVILAMFAISVLLIADIFLLKHSSKDGSLARAVYGENIEKSKQRIHELLLSGNVFDAVCAISSDGDAFKEASEQIQAEADAIEALAFHSRIVSLHEANLLRNDFVGQLLGSKNPTLTLNSYLSYLDMAGRELSEAKKKIETVPGPLKMPEHSLFTVESVHLMKKIDSLASYYKNFTELNDAWTQEDWDKSVKILGSLSDKIKDSEMKGLLVLCENRLKEAETGQKIKIIGRRLSEEELSTEILSQMKVELAEINKSIEDVSVFDPQTGELLNKKSSEIFANMDSAAKILEALSKWKTDINDESAMLSMVQIIASMPQKRIAALRDTIERIANQIGATIKQRI